MTVCANRSDSPGFFTPCRQCPCGKEVAAELAAEQAHPVTVHASAILPRGWSEAWVWTCGCGGRSDSILRTRADAETDHRTEHINRLDNQENR